MNEARKEGRTQEIKEVRMEEGTKVERREGRKEARCGEWKGQWKKKKKHK